MFSFWLSGSQITLIGAVIAAFGAFVSSQTTKDRFDNIDKSNNKQEDLQQATLSGLTNKNQHLQELVQLRKENFSNVMNELPNNTNVDEIIENVKKRKDKKQLFLIENQKAFEDFKIEYEKSLRPVLFIFSEEFRKQIEELEKKGLKLTNKSYDYEANSNLFFDGSTSISTQALSNKYLIALSYSSPVFSEDFSKILSPASLDLPGLNGSVTIMPNEIRIPITPDNIFAMSTDKLDDTEAQKHLVQKVKEAIAFSLSHMLIDAEFEN